MNLKRSLKRAVLAVFLGSSLALTAVAPARAQAPTPGEAAAAAADWLEGLVGQLPLPGQVGSALSRLLGAIRTMAERLNGVGNRTIQQLRQAQDELAGAWAEFRAAVQTAGLDAGGAASETISVVDASLQRLFGLIIVETSGQVAFADGSPAPNTLVVQFVAYDEGWVTGQPGVSLPIPTGYAVTDANGDYTIQHWGGLTAAFRSATGLAQNQGLLPTYVFWPVELLPASPPHRLINYSSDGQASTVAGDQPLAFWQVLGF